MHNRSVWYPQAVYDAFPDCTRCGGKNDTQYNAAPNKEWCTQCNFWGEIARLVKEDEASRKLSGASSQYPRVEGRCYTIGIHDPDTYPGEPKGFGGRAFRIRFDDMSDNLVTTSNLWYRGEVPEDWKELLYDNAVFVEYDWHGNEIINGRELTS